MKTLALLTAILLLAGGVSQASDDYPGPYPQIGHGQTNAPARILVECVRTAAGQARVTYVYSDGKILSGNYAGMYAWGSPTNECGQLSPDQLAALIGAVEILDTSPTDLVCESRPGAHLMTHIYNLYCYGPSGKRILVESWADGGQPRPNLVVTNPCFRDKGDFVSWYSGYRSKNPAADEIRKYGSKYF